MIKKTILIVDDAPENLYLLRLILEGEGYQVIEAINGSEGLKKLHENKQVDLIISDILMPVMDGFKFCQTCKKEKLFKNIPFVFYTSTYTDKSDEDFALKLGADKFLRKPIDHNEVVLTVKNIFEVANNPSKNIKKPLEAEEGIFKLYNERLINKLEQKRVDLENEIIERKKSEEIVIQKEQELNIIYSSLIQPVFMLEVEPGFKYKFVSVNKSFLNVINVTEADVINKHVRDLIPEPSLSLVLKKYKEAIQTKKTVQWEETTPYKTGLKTAIVTVNPIIDLNGNCTHLIGLLYDITNTKNAEIKLKESEKSLLVAQKLAKIGSFSYDFNTEIINGSDTYKEIVGVELDTVITLNIWKTISHPEDTKNNEKVLDNCIKTGKKFNLEYRIITKNTKELKWIEGLGEVVYNNGVATNFIGTIQDITESKLIALEFKKAKEFSEGLIKSMHEGLVVFDLHTKIISVNPAFCKMSGFTEKELIGKSCPYPFSPPEIEDEANIRHEKLTRGELIDEFESTYMRKNGIRFNVHVLVSSIKDIDGTRLAYFGTIQDITARKQAEIELKIAKEFSENLIDSLKTGLSVIDTNGKHLQVNPALCEMTGYSEKELVGILPPFPFWPEEYYDDINDIVEKTFLGIDRSGETIFKRKNGERFPADLTISRVKDEKGIEIAYFATIEDISIKVKAREELKAAKEFSDKLIMSMQEGLLIINLEGEIILVNDSFCEMLGNKRENLLGLNMPYPFAKAEDMDKMKTSITKIVNGENLSLVFEFIRKSGEKFLASFLTGSIKNEKGEVVALFGTMKDISEEEKARIELMAAKEFSDTLLMSLQEGLLIINLEGKIILANDSLCKQLGYKAKELIGLNLPYPFALAEDTNRIILSMGKIEHGENLSLEFELIKKNGETFLSSFLTGNIKNDKGEVVALFGTMKNITEEDKVKKTLEDIALKSIQKKDVILELSALVGSDYNNSLQRITALAASTLNVARVGIWKFIEGRSGIICEKLYNLKTGLYEEGLILNRSQNSNYFDALAENQTININDAVTNSITKGFANAYLLPFGISSMLDVFIQGHKETYGILCFEHVGEPRMWTADEQEFATSIASIVSLMTESSERKIAEFKIELANKDLLKANEELVILRNQLEQENVYLRKELDLVFNYEDMVYGSETFSEVLTEVEKVAPTTATVLLLGESGTGKELLARAVHNISNRNNKPLIKVNCSAIPRELIESELFGHKKGSFTGAITDKIGKFELADGGTLFLDEIGEMPLDMQPQILRFLQEGEIEIVGGTGMKKLDVRVIAATNRNLKEEIEKKQFREDLYFRLNVFPIEVPSLRKRVDDISLLVEHFVDKFNKAYGKNIKYISDDAMSQLKAYKWPGNIRELENLVERAAILSTNETLLIPGFESKTQKTNAPINSKNLSFDAAQRNHILQVLEQCNWKISGPNGAAVLLNLKISTLRDKMAKLGISKAQNK